MYEFIKQSLSSWNHQKDQRRKLQQAYLTVVFIGLVLAGLLTLLNVTQSRLSAMIAAGFAVVYLVNGIAWALLEAFVAPNLPKPESTTNKKTRRQKELASTAANLLELVGFHAAIAQLVERIHGKDEVSGSSPDRGSRIRLFRRTRRNTSHFYFKKL